MSDEGFHEIQLNGKQLVFLFMAATVVAVVIFLCGVMVGRGVPPQRASTGAGETDVVPLDPTARAEDSSLSLSSGSSNASATAGETLTYPDRLADAAPPEETLKPIVEPSAGPPVAAGVPRRQLAAPAAAARAQVVRPVRSAMTAPAAPPADAPMRAAAAASAVAPSAGLTEPSGNGFVVQVAATPLRAAAETIATRLTAKGYPAFVTTAGSNFRVRVGKYGDRRDAESIAGRLAKEERFKPWITR
jgi:cell division septation protein DedD